MSKNTRGEEEGAITYPGTAGACDTPLKERFPLCVPAAVASVAIIVVYRAGLNPNMLTACEDVLSVEGRHESDWLVVLPSVCCRSPLMGRATRPPAIKIESK